MKRRDFLKGMVVSPSFFNPAATMMMGFGAARNAKKKKKSIEMDTSGEGITITDDLDEIKKEKGFKSPTVLWCKIDFSEREFNENKHSMKALESLTDAKLANAKETIMELFEAHINE